MSMSSRLKSASISTLILDVGCRKATSPSRPSAAIPPLSAPLSTHRIATCRDALLLSLDAAYRTVCKHISTLGELCLTGTWRSSAFPDRVLLRSQNKTLLFALESSSLVKYSHSAGGRRFRQTPKKNGWRILSSIARHCRGSHPCRPSASPLPPHHLRGQWLLDASGFRIPLSLTKVPLLGLPYHLRCCSVPNDATARRYRDLAITSASSARRSACMFSCTYSGR